MKNEITAKRLIYALERINMKAQELAIKSGVNKASISQYVNGTHSPSNISAGKMAKVLGVNPVWLMGYDVPMLEDNDVSKYYLDPATADKSQEVYDKMKLLFDAAQDAEPDDIQMAADFLNRMKRTNPDG